jgi:hypothetical protein
MDQKERDFLAVKLRDLIGTSYIDDPELGPKICEWCGEHLTEKEAMDICPECGGDGCPYLAGFDKEV